ncbi:MAG: phosphoglucomutase/phosphomannomutase family protein [Crocinitomicaceae bacterium]|nr:phosphoglucomutase/phosphomannomutase family protein [Crocinitomicaceae bacterium]
MNTPIQFGTDGWRAIIAKDYTVENVARTATGTALWLLQQEMPIPSIVIGHDCRFGGKMFLETTARVMVSYGIKVYYAEGFVSTPMVSLGAQKYKCDLGVVITASHNPPSYNGFKLKASYGGPLSPEKVQEVQDLIPDEIGNKYQSIDLQKAKEEGLYELVDLENDYIEHAKANFDLAAIEKSGLKLAYDAMYGAGQNALKKLLPNITFLHCEENPSFNGIAPEPIAKNLQELSNYIKNNQNIDCALATDGDADRIGLYNSHGEFVDSHHIILLLIHYLVKYKKFSGKVVTAFSCTPRIAKMCEHYELKHETVKIGFKYIAGKMVEGDVLIGGEESGGIATKGHIPERDGIWMGLIIWEYMAKSGKSLEDLIQEVYNIVGSFQFERSDLHIDEALKQRIIAKCKENAFQQFGDYKVERLETVDGFKFFLPNERWVMIRPSGTEPVLRVYAEAPTLEEVRTILKQTEEIVKNI